MHTTGPLHTVMFDRNGNTTVALTASRWIVVSRSGSPDSPVYIQDRVVPDAGTGKSFIHKTLATYEQDAS